MFHHRCTISPKSLWNWKDGQNSSSISNAVKVTMVMQIFLKNPWNWTRHLLDFMCIRPLSSQQRHCQQVEEPFSYTATENSLHCIMSASAVTAQITQSKQDVASTADVSFPRSHTSKCSVYIQQCETVICIPSAQDFYESFVSSR